ncbi:serine hydrolase domain-containing protein [Thioclava sp. F36-7]|uniref:serine hydrolase domain-containing protein n=1 Tax=Thioclava sp. F36-7 TaxID=1915317 RepID=UPI001FF005AE|nr:serine hydrolase domain-containing protein [Thioclava sp. F36-7]
MTQSPAAFTATIDRDERCQAAQSGARLFPYWSFTKPVIAALALMLESEKRLDLDAPLDLPELPEGCTLAHLLDHSAGLPDYGTLPAYHADVAAGRTPWPRDLLVARTLAQPAQFPPGEGWRYSNLGYMLAREVIEGAAAMGLAELVQERITEPLGLESVRLAQTPADFTRLHWPEARDYHPGWVYHRTLIGTAGDAARLLHGLGGLLAPRAFARMTACRELGGALPDRPWTRHGYGLGLMCGDSGDTRVFGHSGAGPFSSNAVYHCPETGRTATAFTHGPFEGPAEHTVAKLVAGR